MPDEQLRRYNRRFSVRCRLDKSMHSQLLVAQLCRCTSSVRSSAYSDLVERYAATKFATAWKIREGVL